VPSRQCLLGRERRLGYTEVREYRLAIGGNEDIARFEVSMYHGAGVRVAQRLGE
jgi:hypothetical protein